MEGRTVGGEFGDGADDAEVGEALFEIEAAQQFAVEAQPVAIVGVGGGEEAPPAGFLRLDDVAQRAVAEIDVADKDDVLDVGQRPFLDVEDQVDAVLFELHDLRLHGRREAAAAPVDLEQPRGVGLHARARIDGAGAQLDLALERFVVDSLVAFEGEAVDDRVLDHPDDHGVAVAPHRHVGEEAGVEQALERSVDRRRVEAVADADLHVGGDGRVLDALIPFHAQLADDVAALAPCGGAGGRQDRRGDKRHDEAHGVSCPFVCP